MAGLLGGSSPAAPDLPPVLPAVKQTDPRLIRVREFMREHACPAHIYAEDFVLAAHRNNLDWRLLPSLSVVESGGGREACHNNIFGWNSCRTGFKSPRDGIHRVAGWLGRSRLYQDKSLDALLKTYNPYPHYPGIVKSVMNQLGPAELAPAGAF
jgi:hypothetical protein